MSKAFDIIGGVIVYGSIALFVWIAVGVLFGAAIAAGQWVIRALT